MGGREGSRKAACSGRSKLSLAQCSLRGTSRTEAYTDEQIFATTCSKSPCAQPDFSCLLYA